MMAVIENVGKCLIDECWVLVLITSWWPSSKLSSRSAVVRPAVLEL